MAGRPEASAPRASAPCPNEVRAGSADDEAVVRAYLRLLVGAPLRASDRLETVEPAFVDVVDRWSERAGIDRRTLAAVGVPRRVLNEAGIRPTPVGELIRRQYSAEPFSVIDLVRRSGASPASVRGVIAEDEQNGQLKRVGSAGRNILYRLR